MALIFPHLRNPGTAALLRQLTAVQLLMKCKMLNGFEKLTQYIYLHIINVLTDFGMTRKGSEKMKRHFIGIAVVLCCISLTMTCMADYDSSVIKQVQQALNDAGFDCGTPDGVAGKGTAAAVSAYQEANGMTVDGQINDDLLVRLGLKEDEAETDDTTAPESIVTDGEMTYEGAWVSIDDKYEIYLPEDITETNESMPEGFETLLSYSWETDKYKMSAAAIKLSAGMAKTMVDAFNQSLEIPLELQSINGINGYYGLVSVMVPSLSSYFFIEGEECDYWIAVNAEPEDNADFTTDEMKEEDERILFTLREISSESTETEMIEEETDAVNSAINDGEYECYEGSSFPKLEAVLPAETVGFIWPDEVIQDYPDSYQILYVHTFGPDNEEGVDFDRGQELKNAYDEFMSDKFEVKYTNVTVTKLSDTKDSEFFRTVFIDGDKGALCTSGMAVDSANMTTGGTDINVVIITSLSSLFE